MHLTLSGELLIWPWICWLARPFLVGFTYLRKGSRTGLILCRLLRCCWRCHADCVGLIWCRVWVWISWWHCWWTCRPPFLEACFSFKILIKNRSLKRWYYLHSIRFQLWLFVTHPSPSTFLRRTPNLRLTRWSSYLHTSIPHFPYSNSPLKTQA